MTVCQKTQKMSDFSNASALFYDYGLFVSMAEVCAGQFGRVGYFCPWENSFSDGRELAIGVGLEGIERIKYFDKVVDDYDLIVFPDCHDGWLQRYLREHGYRVWGSSIGSELELSRWKTKELFREKGIPQIESHQVQGTAALREFFKSHGNEIGWFVKVSGFRGLGETWFARNYDEAKGVIDEFDVKHAVMAMLVDFVVEANIPNAKEIGYDGLSILGQFPLSAFWGIEKKDKAYFGKLSKYEEMPKEVKAVNEAVAPTMRDLGYCNWFSTELRNGVPIDLTCRHASPAGEPMIAAMENLAEVLWYGAEGILVEPQYSAKFGAQLILCSEWAEEHLLELSFPEDIRQWVKIYNHARIDGKDYFVPQIAKMKQVGSVIGLANTPEEAVKLCKRRAAEVRGFDIECDFDSLDEAMNEMQSSKP